MQTELKPCPFCGSEGKLTQKRSLETWIVECTNNSCPASYMIGYDYDTSEEAIEAWNRRATDADWERFDAGLALLKQEAVEPNGARKAMSFAFNGMLTGHCPRCGTIVNSVGNSGACGKCGQKLDWEGR